MASIALVAVGLILASTFAFPDVRCQGDFCLITMNAFALPAIVSGTALGLLVIAARLWERSAVLRPRSVK